MSNDSDFNQLLQRAQEGDRDAIGRIYQLYIPHLQRVTRHRLRRLGLETVTTSADVGDSVFRQLLKPGAFDKITNAAHLRNFLVKACGNKAMDILCKVLSDKRDPRPAPFSDDMLEHSYEELLDPLEQEEELARIYAQLSPRERLLCTLRRGGCGWDEIAQRLNTTAVGARQAFSRGFRRAKQLVREE